MKNKTKSYQSRGVTRELNMCRMEELTWQTVQAVQSIPLALAYHS